MDTMTKVNALKFIGNLVGGWNQYKNFFHLSVEESPDGALIGSFSVTGPLAQQFKELVPNVKKTVDQKAVPAQTRS